MKLDIRRFEARDGDAVWHLHNRALEGTGAHGGNGEWDKDVTDPIRYYLESEGEFLVGYLGDELVAMGGFMRHSAELVEIKRMRVEPTLQRRGYGRLILEELERRALEAGYGRAFLVTTDLQAPAHALYRSCGYVVSGYGKEGPFNTVEFSKPLD